MDDETATDTESTIFGVKRLLKQFISTYQNYPLLWNKENSDYTNRHKRQRALLKLAEILRKIKPGADVEDVKKKINSLRSNYRKELQKIMDSQDASKGDWSDIYKPRSWVFYELTFLGNIGNVHAPQELLKRKFEEPSENENEHDNEFLVEKLEPQESTSGNSTPLPSYPTEAPRKKQKIKRPERTFSYATSFPGQSDDNIHQATVWANKLNSLEPLQKIYAEKAINDILFEAELGNLTRNSVTDGGVSEIVVIKRDDEAISRL